MTKVLIDSSSWIHFFNQSSPWHFETVSQAIREDRAVTCGLVITEVLRGARNHKETKILSENFNLLEYLPFQQEDYWESAKLGFDLARKGLAVKTIDLLIAHLATKHHFTLVHQDSDFELITRHTPLKTLSENVSG